MKRHSKTVYEKMLAHVCPYCDGVSFGAKSTLKTRIKTVHEKRRDHACQYCPGVAFGEKGNLTKHIHHVDRIN
jgi:hypothetical protein